MLSVITTFLHSPPESRDVGGKFHSDHYILSPQPPSRYLCSRECRNDLFKERKVDSHSVNFIFLSGSQLDELQKMNLVPQSWLLRVYAQHYHAVRVLILDLRKD